MEAWVTRRPAAEASRPITEGGGDSHALVVLVDIQTVQIPCVAVYVPKAHGAPSSTATRVWWT